MYNAEMTINEQKLYDLLFTKEFDKDKLVSMLSAGAFSVEEIDTAASVYVEDCINLLDYDDSRFENAMFGEDIPGIESSHFLEAIRILLEYGLDPNYCSSNSFTDYIIGNLRFVFNGYQSADAAALMFEHGGNPNMIFDDCSLIDDLDFDVMWFLGGDVDSRYIADSFMHYWMTVVGYGARFTNGADVVVEYGNFKACDFRDHRNYYCGFIHVKDDDGSVHLSAISFFDKRTNREVARLE